MNLLSLNISIYISYSVIAMFVYILLFNFFNDKEKIRYKPGEKKFNTEIPKEEGNKIIRENSNSEISEEIKKEFLDVKD